jgi:hypothetical protein
MKRLALIIVTLGLVLFTTAQTTYFSSNGSLALDKSLKLVSDNTINPLQGQYLGKIITSNTTFTITPFPNNYYQLEFNYYNPQKYQINFVCPSRNIVWMNGPAPDKNSIRGTILFADLFGELRATQ